MSLLISDEIINLTNYTEKEFELEIAILFYQKKDFPWGKLQNFQGL